MSKDPAIETYELTKYYGKIRGIEGLDLQVEKGDFFGFIGPNGAGKSTAIRTLLGLIKKTSGNAKVLGYDISEEKEISSFGDPFLFEDEGQGCHLLFSGSSQKRLH